MTAVEWLVEELQKAEYIPKDSIIMDYVIKLSKEMEKQQIADAYKIGRYENNKIVMPERYYAEQYYNETFNK
jgi:hypothetical protein